MCGINGLLYKRKSRMEKGMVTLMNNAMIHRGPDEEGIYENNDIALGMRRLRIIDLNTGGQPVYNEKKDIVTIFNGEIYNFRELRKDLENKGHRFYTNSDTEVIVHQYEEDGERCVEKFRGMFAIALWDSVKKKLLLMRDRLGIKPLFYFENYDYFAFSSEIKGLLILPGIERKIDINSLSDYFSLLYVPTPNTIFENIKQIPAGHVLIHNIKEKRFEKYWEIENVKQSNVSESDQIDEFIELFKESVKLRLISDVPLGSFLSGGIDSSLIVAMMSEMKTSVETFSIGYPKGDEYFDERKYAKIISAKYGTEHHELIIEPDLATDTEKIIRSFDEPFADASAIPNYYLAKYTRNYVTVSLSGLGGDELAGGYERYLGHILAGYYQKMPDIIIKRILPKVAEWIPDTRNGDAYAQRLKRFIRTGYLPSVERYFNIIARYNEEEKRELFTKDIIGTLEKHQSLDTLNNIECHIAEADQLTKLILLDMKSYMVDDLLKLTDRMSMAHSLEVRVPFLDHKLVEYFFRVPSNMKIRKLEKKYILKRAAERYLPKDNIYRQKKGFSVPLVLWFRGKLKEYVREVLSKSSIEKLGYFEYDYVNRVMNEHFERKSNNDEKIWALIVFLLWHHEYIENRPEFPKV